MYYEGGDKDSSIYEGKGRKGMRDRKKKNKEGGKIALQRRVPDK